MADLAVLRFPVERAAALATRGPAVTSRQDSDGAEAGSTAPTPDASSNRITAIEAAGALAGMDLLHAYPTEQLVQQSAGRDPAMATSIGEPAATVAPPLPLDRPPAQDRNPRHSDDQEQSDSRALELVRALWTGSAPREDVPLDPRADTPDARRGASILGDDAGDPPPAGAELDAPPPVDRNAGHSDEAQFEARALELARAFWPGSGPPHGAEGAGAGAGLGPDTPSDDAQQRQDAETSDASREPAILGTDTPPALAVVAAALPSAPRSRLGFGVAAGVVLAVCVGIAIPILPDRTQQVAAPGKPVEETAARLVPQPPDVPAPVASAALPPAEASAVVQPVTPADPPRPPPAASSSVVTVEPVAKADVAPSPPAPPPLILADVLPPEDSEAVILRPVSPSPPSATPASHLQSPMPPVKSPVTILRAASPSSSPPIASIPSSAPSKALPPIVLMTPPDDDRGAGALIVHPAPPPVENAPPQAGAPALVQASPLDVPASSLARVEPAARPASAAVAAPVAGPSASAPKILDAPPLASRPGDAAMVQAAPGPTPGPTPSPVPVEQRPAIDPGQAAAMMRRADALAAIGDFSGARLFYERLAVGGSHPAALALARSYDPAWLRQQGVVGVPPDATRAAYWYARAAADQAQQAKP